MGGTSSGFVGWPGMVCDGLSAIVESKVIEPSRHNEAISITPATFMDGVAVASKHIAALRSSIDSNFIILKYPTASLGQRWQIGNVGVD